MDIIRPTRAVVLAAGFGARLLPLSRDLPKPLMPLWGRALLDRALDLLAGWGVRDVLINLHHGADEIRRHVRAAPRGSSTRSRSGCSTPMWPPRSIRGRCCVIFSGIVRWPRSGSCRTGGRAR